jgi:transposase
VIDAILEDDKNRPIKQRHTAKRIFDRLREEHGYPGGYTIVKDYVGLQKMRKREMFVPLTHAPGHAQADFGEALVVITGVEQKAHYFAMDLPQSDDCFVAAFPAANNESRFHLSRSFAKGQLLPAERLSRNKSICTSRFSGLSAFSRDNSIAK